jgi:hypothetical protein
MPGILKAIPESLDEGTRADEWIRAQQYLLTTYRTIHEDLEDLEREISDARSLLSQWYQRRRIQQEETRRQRFSESPSSTTTAMDEAAAASLRRRTPAKSPSPGMNPSSSSSMTNHR